MENRFDRSQSIRHLVESELMSDIFIVATHHAMCVASNRLCASNKSLLRNFFSFGQIYFEINKYENLFDRLYNCKVFFFISPSQFCHDAVKLEPTINKM